MRQNFLCLLNLTFESVFSSPRARQGTFHSLHVGGEVCAIRSTKSWSSRESTEPRIILRVNQAADNHLWQMPLIAALGLG